MTPDVRHSCCCSRVVAAAVERFDMRGNSRWSGRSCQSRLRRWACDLQEIRAELKPRYDRVVNSAEHQVVFRDYPIGLWSISVMTLTAGWWAPDTIWERLLFALMGITLFAFSSILTVTVDPEQRTCTLHYRSLMRVTVSVYSLSEICFVNVARDWEGERLYRLELILRSGETIPLRSWYSGGKRRYELRAQRLRSFLGVHM